MTQPTEFLQISHSSRSTGAGCMRRFEFRKMFPRANLPEDAYAAEVGKAIHAGVQDWLVNQDEDRATWELMKAFPHEESFVQEKDDRNFDAALATQDAIFESNLFGDYVVSQIRRPDGLIVPAIEVPFAIELAGITLPDGRGIQYVGFIDAIMQHIGSSHHRTVDIKTHRNQRKDRTAEYKFNGQQLPYGLIVDHIAGQSGGDFEVMYLDCFVDLVEPRIRDYSFTKTQEDVQEWLLDTVLFCQGIQKAMEMDHFPRAVNGCMGYNKPCPYLDICDERDTESLRQWFLMGEEPVWPKPVEPWVTAQIDVFA